MLHAFDTHLTPDTAARDALAWCDLAGRSFVLSRGSRDRRERWEAVKHAIRQIRSLTASRLERRGLAGAWASAGRRIVVAWAATSAIGCASTSSAAKPLATACGVAVAACAVVESACAVATSSSGGEASP